MDNSGTSVHTQQEPEKQTLSAFDAVKSVISKTNRAIDVAGLWLFHLRKIVLSVPVVYCALKLAAYNQEHLPEQVGLNLQATGEFAQYISRNMAIMGPLALTGACLLLMFCSRKAMYPWVISIFTLTLPLLLLLSNIYPS